VKIFQVITVSEFGGAQAVVANICEAVGDGNDIYILYGGNGEAWEHLKDKVHLIKLNEHRKNISWKDALVAFKLLYYKYKYQPDIVHLHSSKMGVLGRIIFNPRKVILTMHGFDSVRKGFPKFLIIEKKLKNRAARIVGVSNYDVEALKEEGIKSNVSLVYNGLIDNYTNSKKVNESPIIADQLKRIKQQYPYIIMCISRISAQKKFDLFVEIAKNKPEYAFVWIGNKEPVKDLPSNTYCLGETSFAQQYLRYADLFILPTNYEGLPISILEALCFKVPVIASSVGGVTEILNGENGFAVDNNVSDFIEKIDFSLKEENYDSMKENARKSFLERFTIQDMIDGYISIYSEMSNK